MSNKLQDNKTTRTILILVAAVIIGATGWYVMRSRDNANQSLDNAENVQASEDANAEAAAYEGWKDHTWEGLSFQFPGDWFVEENTGIGRAYVKNSKVDLLKEATPADFQQVWLSVDTDEAAASREEAIKQGESMFRVVDGEVTTSTLKAGDLTVNVYEYNTLGGPTLEAYWTGKDGKRYYATNSTEVGEANQTEMVATLKKLLATVKLQ